MNHSVKWIIMFNVKRCSVINALHLAISLHMKIKMYNVNCNVIYLEGYYKKQDREINQ